MISSEKDLEDYICNNQEQFIKKLKEVFCVEKIAFVGRQIRIGNENIADLVYITQPSDKYPIRELIIVELKFRELFCKDLAQINRYICTLQEIDEYLSFENIYGCFVSFGCSDEMKDVCKSEKNIKFISLHCSFDFCEEKYCYSEDYLKNIKIDDRLKKYMINADETNADEI